MCSLFSVQVLVSDEALSSLCRFGIKTLALCLFRLGGNTAAQKTSFILSLVQKEDVDMLDGVLGNFFFVTEEKVA